MFIFNTELLLIGITSVWHGVTVVVVSLIGILCFASATQGWMLTRMSMLERLLLLFVVVALFRPAAIMNQLSPEYQELDLSVIANNQNSTLPADRSVRLHITRETEYGDRYKLFVIPPLQGTTDREVGLSERVVLTVELEPDNRLIVVNTQFNGPADTKGVTFGDYITDIDVEQPGRPAKQWIYLPGFFVLALIIYFQLRKSKRDNQAVAVDRAL